MRNIISLSQWWEPYVKAMEDDDGECLDFLYSYWFARKSFMNGKPDENMDNIRKHKPKNSELYIDSGVFSARKLGEVIPVDELIKFYHKNADIVDYVFGMDEGSLEEQFEKTSEMIKQGVPTIPIIHLGYTNLKDILRYANMGIDFLGAGFYHVSTGTSKSKNQFNIPGDVLFKYFKDHDLQHIKTHLLGTENFYSANRWPLYSIDSSNVINTLIFGNVSYFDKNQVLVDRIHPRKDVLNTFRKLSKNYDIRYFIEDYAKELIDDMTDVEINKIVRENRGVQSIKERFKFQKLLTDIWTGRGVTWD